MLKDFKGEKSYIPPSSPTNGGMSYFKINNIFFQKNDYIPLATTVLPNDCRRRSTLFQALVQRNKMVEKQAYKRRIKGVKRG